MHLLRLQQGQNTASGGFNEVNVTRVAMVDQYRVVDLGRKQVDTSLSPHHQTIALDRFVVQSVAKTTSGFIKLCDTTAT